MPTYMFLSAKETKLVKEKWKTEESFIKRNTVDHNKLTGSVTQLAHAKHPACLDGTW